MKAKKRHLMIVAVVAVAVAFMGINGCKKSGSEVKKATGDNIQLCLECGLAKGSPGCCKIPKQ